MKLDVFATNAAAGGAHAGAELPDWLAARGGAPDFIALHQDADLGSEWIGDAVPTTGAFHGATSCLGVMSERGVFIDRGVGALCIWDADGRFGTAMRPLGEDAAAAGAAAVQAALERADRPGEAPDLIWLSAAPGREEQVLAGIASVVGTRVPILGGSAADNNVSGRWAVFDREGAERDGVIVSVLFPSTAISFAYHNGYAPTERSGVVTRAEGRRIFEIDGEPAARVYDRWTEGSVLPRTLSASTPILSESTLSPFGRYLDQVGEVPYFLLAHPAAVDPDGALHVFADIAEGERVTLMTGSVESLTARAGKVANLARLTGIQPMGECAGGLMVYCGGCMLAVRDSMDAVVDGVTEALPGLPFLGVFTYGEQGVVMDGSNRHGNLMISCILFER